MIRLILTSVLSISVYLFGLEVVDFVETRRFLNCAQIASDPRDCDKGQSWLYQHYPEGPHVASCLRWDAEDRFVCRLFGIKRDR